MEKPDTVRPGILPYATQSLRNCHNTPSTMINHMALERLLLLETWL